MWTLLCTAHNMMQYIFRVLFTNIRCTILLYTNIICINIRMNVLESLLFGQVDSHSAHTRMYASMHCTQASRYSTYGHLVAVKHQKCSRHAVEVNNRCKIGRWFQIC